MATKSTFHLHMISDSTGETIASAARAVTSQYIEDRAIEHIYPLIRNQTMLDKAIEGITANPGIVLFTMADADLSDGLERACRDIGVPCVSVLDPIFQVFQSYLGKPTKRVAGAQHALDKEYFNRIDALNFTMLHDDGALPEDPEEADVILIGISRTSKTPTSIYLANRGIKTANYPLVPGVDVPEPILNAKTPLIVALLATTERIQQVRQNRLLELNAESYGDTYADRASIAEELKAARRLCHKHHWPTIDVTRKSIEETAAAIISLHAEHIAKLALEH